MIKTKIKKIIKKIKTLLVIKVPMENRVKHSFLLTWILTNLDINVSGSDSDITQLAYWVFCFFVFCFY
jgi:hypothetical protein